MRLFNLDINRKSRYKEKNFNLIIQLTQNDIIKNTVQFFFNNFSTRIVEACAICRLSKLKRFK